MAYEDPEDFSHRVRQTDPGVEAARLRRRLIAYAIMIALTLLGVAVAKCWEGSSPPAAPSSP